jgi:hypothetical protein
LSCRGHRSYEQQAPATDDDGMSKQADRPNTRCGDARHPSRSRSRQRDELQPRRQLRSHTRADVVRQVAYANNPRSISCLHDDELSCVLPFLSLVDLSQLVRCSRRFNSAARKERGRGLQLEGDAAIAPFSSSPLNHHVSSVALRRHYTSAMFVTQQTLRNLKDSRQLTALSLELPNHMDSDKLMQGQATEQFGNTFTSILPTQLRSFRASLGCEAAFCSALFAALWVMPQLTELAYYSMNAKLALPSAVLSQLSHLRKLELGINEWTAALSAEVKQLNQLRELHLHQLKQQEVITLCEPPHALQLETIELLSRMSIDSAGMHALLQLPTLTALDPGFLAPEAWFLFSELPLLQKLSLDFYDVTAEHLTVLSAALSHCGSLRDLSLHLSFEPEETEEQPQACWADLLRSMPNVRRLTVSHSQLTPMRAVLPLHLPLLEELSLNSWDLPEVVLPQLAHPNVRQIQLRSYGGKFPEAQVRALIHSKQLPKLERISCIDPPEDEQ